VGGLQGWGELQQDFKAWRMEIHRVPEANPSRVCGNKARRQAASSEGDESPRHPQFRHSRPEQSCSKVGASSPTEDQEMMTVYWLH
jgi:hypothetical protein